MINFIRYTLGLLRWFALLVVVMYTHTIPDSYLSFVCIN